MKFFLIHILWLGLLAFARANADVDLIKVVDTNVVLYVQVDAGYSYLRVETKNDLLADAAWKPVQTQPLSGLAGSLMITLPQDRLERCFRVRCYEAESAPAGLFEGESTFTSDPVRAGSSAPGELPPIAQEDNLAPGPDGAAGAAERTVTDADIWAIDGDRLYFFNRSVGLQVIDLATPDTPALLGQLPLPGRGEKLIPLSSSRVLLVAGQDCLYRQGDPESEGIVVDVSSGNPRITARFPIVGRVQEARTVGTALYVVAYSYRNRDGSYRSATSVQSFDLAEPDAPAEVSHEEWPGFAQFIHATSSRAVIGSHDYRLGSTLQVFDIGSPAGELVRMGTIAVNGRVADEFKVYTEDNLLAVIAQEWNDSRRNWSTSFRTWDLGALARASETNAPPDAPTDLAPLGELDFALNEQLFGTRFGDNRTAYVVTFERIDPLWIIDFSDPADPRILGELLVPGFSTHLVPLNDEEVLSIGRESNRVAVSLFDVSDTSNPILASRVYLGDTYSWSEATYEENAFTVLPEAGVILVPFTSRSGSGLQFIDLLPGRLVEQGFLAHPTAPRRADAIRDRFLAIDSRNLTVIDAVDRANPQVTASLELNQPVTRVFAEDPLRIELDTTRPRPRVRINDLILAGEALRAVDLPEGHVLGSAHRPGELHLLQRGEVTEGGGTTLRALRVDTGDLSYEATEFNSTNLPWYGNAEPLWVRDDLLVWNIAGYYYYFDDVLVGPTVEGPARSFLPPDWGSPSLVAIDLSGDAPRFASDFQPPGSRASNPWSVQFSVFAGGGQVLIGRTFDEFVYGPRPGLPPAIAEELDRRMAVGEDNVGVWWQTFDLLVLDYESADRPVARDPISFPGRLAGASDDGILLYATRARRDAETGQVQPDTDLIALAYDGMAAFQLDQVEVGDHYGHPPLVVKNRAVHALVRHRGETDFRVELRAWELQGRELVAGDVVPVENSAWTLERRKDLLVFQAAGQLEFHDVSEPLHPEPKLVIRPEKGCAWENWRNGDGCSRTGFVTPAHEFGALEYLFINIVELP